MRPCQHCYAALGNEQKRCPVCGASQAATVGLNAPSLPDATSAESMEESFAEEATVRQMVLSCVAITGIGVPLVGWMAGGGVGLMVSCGALLLLIVAAQFGWTGC